MLSFEVCHADGSVFVSLFHVALLIVGHMPPDETQMYTITSFFLNSKVTVQVL